MTTLSGGFSIDNYCIKNPTYDQYKENNFEPIGCGDRGATIALFSIFTILISMIFLNLFIAIILQGYDETRERNEKMFNSEVRDQFRDIWSRYDQDATGFIKVEYFPQLMMDLGPPLGWDMSFKDNKVK